MAQQLRELETKHAKMKEETNSQMESLNNGLIIAQQYQSDHENLVQWISEQINTLDNMEAVNLSTETIQQQMKANEVRKLELNLS